MDMRAIYEASQFYDLIVETEARLAHQDYIYDDGQFNLNDEDDVIGIDNITAKVYDEQGEEVEAPKHSINKLKKGKIRRIR